MPAYAVFAGFCGCRTVDFVFGVIILNYALIPINMSALAAITRGDKRHIHG